MVWEAFNLKDNHYFGQETRERGCKKTALKTKSSASKEVELYIFVLFLFFDRF